MNKTSLVKALAKKSKLSQKDSTAVLDAFIDVVTETLAKGEKVELLGFGGFDVRTRAAREGRNPQTGEPVQIAAAKLPTFKAGKGLKEAVNHAKNSAQVKTRNELRDRIN